MARSLAALFVLSLAGRAQASDGQGAAATAQALYEEGRRLVAEGHAHEGCDKLAESNRVDPAVGTRFYLGDCYERIGRTASAWALFLEVATASKLRGHTERENLAKSRALALEGKLSRLTIVVDAPAKDESVRRDDIEVGRAAWGIAVPVDPGEHAIVVNAPEHKPWTSKVVVPADGGMATVRVPRLVPAPQADTGRAEPSDTRALGLIFGGFGLAAMGVGVYAGTRAIAKNSDSKEHCVANVCDAAGKSLRDEAITAAWIANGSVALGAIATGIGAYLFFSSSPKRESSPVTVGFGPSSVSLAGAF